ncbi:MAG: alpha-glucuronidase [Defluviitaleaceae bacterium]|nr:alpha-glucuronidase [Defluviitaleaceae bacterium]
MVSTVYDTWLRYDINKKHHDYSAFAPYFARIYVSATCAVTNSAVEEIKLAAERIFGTAPEVVRDKPKGKYICLCFDAVATDAYKIVMDADKICVFGKTSTDLLYGTFRMLFNMVAKGGGNIAEAGTPRYALRSINHWDNGDGTIERGYSGNSIFFDNNQLTNDHTRIRDYARMMASIGINAISINNVNVHEVESRYITEDFLPGIAKYAEIFENYGIALYLSVNYASPMELGGLNTADPLDAGVKQWWKDQTTLVYKHIPNLGGYVVKADSENRPGPFTYGRNHADGANMLAEALAPHGGKVVWRCFVYDCHLDWRDRSIDRAKAAYDHFVHLDGKFSDNVYLQIKNGPMDFQIREATSPLLGAMPATNQIVEFQIAQEYTGHQIDLCYLIGMFKECLDFDTFRNGQGSYVKNHVLATAAVTNLGNDKCWTGHPLAAANLFGYGRIAYNTELSAEEIAAEWLALTMGCGEEVSKTVLPMLLSSREAYENYTTPFGLGWMVKTHLHYGVGVDDYEYSAWGTYHYANHIGFGVDRTVKSGTGYTAQYCPENAALYENIETCPEELLLFFHFVPYNHVMKNGKTLLQNYYNKHFIGCETAEKYLAQWEALAPHIDDKELYEIAHERFQRQLKNAIQWRDVVNTYFYRRTGTPDECGRKIYP